MTSNPTHISAPAGTPFIDLVREFDAPRELVFRAWVDPDLVSQWLGPRDLQIHVLEFDARTGGSYRYVHTAGDGTEYGFRGVFHTVTEPELIIQTFEFDGAAGSVSLEAMDLDDLDGRTRLRQHSVFPTVEIRDAALATGMESGMTESMDRLDEVLTSAAGRAEGR